MANPAARLPLEDAALSTTRDSGASQDTHRELAPRGELSFGAVVGRFVVGAKLGHGGLGVVYLGYDPRLNRHAAIKLLQSSSPNANARMLREARALAQLSHPNVVQVYESDVHETGIYIAMEHVDGPTLRQWLASKQRGLSEVCECLIDAGRGLAAAHEKGLIHRDFKPENVMIGSDGRVRVLDFGLALLPQPTADPTVEQTAANTTTRLDETYAAMLTSANARMGTPAYMAPEQHRGVAVDARTDQFSFCVSLWEALYGERPFAGVTLLALSSSVIHGRIRQPPEETKVPAELHAVLVRGLATEPNDRWSSMNELLAALEAVTKPASASPSVSVSRNPNWVILAIVFGLVNGAIGMYLGEFVGIVLSTLSSIATFYAAEMLAQRGNKP